MKLRRYHINPFKDPEISVEELVSYGLEHLARMTANNPGSLNSIITLTGNWLTTLDGKITSETVRLGLQMASVQAKNDFRAALSVALSKLHGACLAVWGSKHPKMLEIFPGGLTAFSDANDDQLDNVLDALEDALTANSLALTTAPGLAAGALASTWAGLYGMVNTTKGQKLNAADLRNAAILGLKNQLFQNVLVLAALFPDDEAKANLYYPQHLLEDHPAQAEDPVVPPVG